MTIVITEQGSAPASPAAGKRKLYPKSDGWYEKNSAGVETGPFGVSGFLPTGFLYGLTLSNNGTDPTNDIDIATGKCRSIDDAADLTLGSALTKRLDAAWAVGTNQGGLDTGSIANSTYHVFLIKRSDTGVVDVLFSTSATSPTMPANYNYKRRIGSFWRSGGTILAFVQDGDTFSWKAPVSDLNVNNPGTSAVLRTLSVPNGIRVEAIFSVILTGGTNFYPSAAYFTDPSIDDVAPVAGTSGFNAYSGWSGGTTSGQSSTFRIFTNTSSQIRSRLQNSDASTSIYICTMGWVDTRGRLG